MPGRLPAYSVPPARTAETLSNAPWTERCVALRCCARRGLELADHSATHEAAEIRLDPILSRNPVLHVSILPDRPLIGIGQTSDFASAPWHMPRSHTLVAGVPAAALFTSETFKTATFTVRLSV